MRIFTYNCNLCGSTSLTGEGALYTHMKGKKHLRRLKDDFVPEAEQFRAFIAKHAVETTEENYEPTPPGLEDKIETSFLLNSIAKNELKSLIGLGYVLECYFVVTKDFLFICILCETSCNSRKIIAHVTSHRHRIKYLVRKHFFFCSQINRLS
jgi:Zinc-finger of C2H2 type